MKPELSVKILLVDDRPENLLALEVMLANKNYELVKATSGKEALKTLLKSQDFVLILMDALMPIMDGFETAALIRQSEKLKHIPIIFLTAQMGGPDNIFKGYQLGAVDYMLKPLSAEILKAKVAVFVDLYIKNNELVAKKAILKIKMKQLAEAQWLAHVGSWEWDLATNKIEWSDELYRIFGFEPQKFDPTYENFIKHIHQSDQAYADSVIQQAHKDHQPFNFFHKVVRTDGKIRILNSIGKVIADNNGNFKMIGTAQDITEQKEAEEQALRLIKEKNDAERARLVAEETTKSKQQFLANMSHEIRTPMNAIIGFTKVILKTNLDEKQKEYLNAIKVSGDSLLVLINDILDLAKVDAGKMTFEAIPFQLAASVSSMLLLFETKLRKNKLTLVRYYDTSIPNVLIGDPIRLQQILINLLSNAVKFTTRGKITVSVCLIRQDDENAIIEFSVTDTGIGIPEDQIEKIFDNFQQAHSKTNYQFGGTGLGLAIVKQLVEAQQGTLKVRSKLGEGSTFSFILSFKKTALKIEIQPEYPFAFNSKIKNVKVLLAEDVKLNQLLMKTMLETFGFEMQIAENGRIVIEKLKKDKYDVILMDLQMPEMNGFEATEYIRKDMDSKIPIIALTADVTSVDVEKCRSAGMNDYISKPVDEKVLYTKITKCIIENSHCEKGSDMKNHQEKQKHSVIHSEQKCTNLDFLENMTKGNSEMITEMINVYLEETPKFISRMKQSIRDMDWESVNRISHSFMPSFATVGINKEFTGMTKKISEYAGKKESPEKIKELFLIIEKICLQACEELERDLVSLEKR